MCAQGAEEGVIYIYIYIIFNISCDIFKKF